MYVVVFDGKSCYWERVEGRGSASGNYADYTCVIRINPRSWDSSWKGERREADQRLLHSNGGDKCSLHCSMLKED